MTAMLGLFLKGCALLMAAVLAFLPAAPVKDVSYSAADAEAILLNAVVLSDVHMETNTIGRFTAFRDALRDINASETENEALVLLGDNTMNGQITEYIMLYSLLTAFNRIDNTLIVMGNHDINQSSNTMSAALKKHNAFYNAYTGSNNEETYYYRVINGYYFIVLGSEDADAGTSSVISDEQLQWLDETLALAAAEEKPIFIFHHQPFSHILGNSAEVYATIANYDDVIYFSGHMHTPVRVTETPEGVTLVNLPNFYDSDEDPSGIGMQIEAYEDYVLLSARAYVKGEWVEEHVYRIDL